MQDQEQPPGGATHRTVTTVHVRRRAHSAGHIVGTAHSTTHSATHTAIWACCSGPTPFMLARRGHAVSAMTVARAATATSPLCHACAPATGGAAPARPPRIGRALEPTSSVPCSCVEEVASLRSRAAEGIDPRKLPAFVSAAPPSRTQRQSAWVGGGRPGEGGSRGYARGRDDWGPNVVVARPPSSRAHPATHAPPPEVCWALAGSPTWWLTDLSSDNNVKAMKTLVELSGAPCGSGATWEC